VNKKPYLFKIEQYLTGELSPVEIHEFEVMMELNSGFKEYVQIQRSIRYEGPIPVLQAQIQRINFSVYYIFIGLCFIQITRRQNATFYN
jgi:hypothetical protein